MNERDVAGTRHELNIVNREEVYVKGVIHVESFDEEEVVLDTDLGSLVLKEEDFRIKQLNLDEGNFAVEGLLVSIHYGQSLKSRGGGRGSKGLWGKLLK